MSGRDLVGAGPDASPKRTDGTASRDSRRPFAFVATACGVVSVIFGALAIATSNGDRAGLRLGIVGTVLGVNGIALGVATLIFRRPRSGASLFGQDPEQDEREAAAWYANQEHATGDESASAADSPSPRG
jgi:hypothetical protein